MSYSEVSKMKMAEEQLTKFYLKLTKQDIILDLALI